MDETLSTGSLVTRNGSVCFTKLEDLKKCEQKYVHNAQISLKGSGMLEPSEDVLGLCEQVSFVDTMGDLDDIVGSRLHFGNEVVEVCSMEMYEVIEAFNKNHCLKQAKGPEVFVETKYKSVAKKVKPVASPLPPNNREKIEQASLQPSLRDPKTIGHIFTKESFQEL